MDENVAAELNKLLHTHFRIMFGMLHKKGILDYADIQEEISEVRDSILKDDYSTFMARSLDILERTYSNVPYQSPIPPEGDPDH